MAVTPAVTDLDQLRDRAALSVLLAWNQSAVQGAKFDRNELSIYIARENVRDAVTQLKSQGLINFLSDVTCADFYPREPRFELAYHLLSIPRKERVRLKVKLSGEDPVIDPSCRPGRPPTSLSVKFSICLESAFSAIRTCGGS